MSLLSSSPFCSSKSFALQRSEDTLERLSVCAQLPREVTWLVLEYLDKDVDLTSPDFSFPLYEDELKSCDPLKWMGWSNQGIPAGWFDKMIVKLGPSQVRWDRLARNLGASLDYKFRIKHLAHFKRFLGDNLEQIFCHPSWADAPVDDARTAFQQCTRLQIQQIVLEASHSRAGGGWRHLDWSFFCRHDLFRQTVERAHFCLLTGAPLHVLERHAGPSTWADICRSSDAPVAFIDENKDRMIAQLWDVDPWDVLFQNELFLKKEGACELLATRPSQYCYIRLPTVDFKDYTDREFERVVRLIDHLIPQTAALGSELDGFWLVSRNPRLAVHLEKKKATASLLVSYLHYECKLSVQFCKSLLFPPLSPKMRELRAMLDFSKWTLVLGCFLMVVDLRSEENVRLLETVEWTQELKTKLCRNPTLTDSACARLLGEEDDVADYSLALSDNVSPHLSLDFFLSNVGKLNRVALCKNPSLPPKYIEQRLKTILFSFLSGVCV